MIDILLATYNSEKYLQEQINSIIAQDFDNWKLLIRDGGSTDSTLEIVNEYCLSYPAKIKLIISDKRYTAVENFSALLEASTASYVMFADHDDVWFKNKVSKSFDKMKESEDIFGLEMPLLIFSDKSVVDENLQQLSFSCFKYQKLNPLKTALNFLLVQNVPTGCSILINRQLINKAGQIPLTAVMHDHWISLVATAFGKIVYLDEPTLYYRQHGGNIFGANIYGWNYFYKRYKLGLSGTKKSFYMDVKQASAFLNKYRHMLSCQQIEMLEAFSALREKSLIEKRRVLIKYKIYKSGWLRNIGMMLII